MHATAHGGCADTIIMTDCTGHRFGAPGLEPASVLRLVFRSNALRSELSRLTVFIIIFKLTDLAG